MMTLLHVAFGTIALAVVPAAILARKGGRWHRRFGIAFTLAMSVVLFTAGFLWQAKGHLFLVPLAAVTAYLLFNGRRVIARRRRRHDDPIADNVDRLAAVAMIAAGCATAYLGWSPASALVASIAPALLGVGGIAIAFGVNELVGFHAVRHPQGWKLSHVAAMIAAYVSAVTAFLVINAHGVPMILRWAIPSAAGACAIAAATLRIVSLRWPAGREGHERAERRRVATATPSPQPDTL